jgi:putative ABC transport system permease protein
MLESKFPAMLSKYLMTDFAAYFGPDYDVNDVFKIKLKPLVDIHLDPTRNFEIAPQGNKMAVYSLSIIAFLILSIACINFINLSTANANRRAQEVGMRKTIGASRHQLWKQFLGESIVLAGISLILAIFIIEFLLPLFNQISGKEFSGMMIFHDNNFVMLMLLALGTGVIAGIYPAFLLSAYDPIKALKGSVNKVSKRANFRNIMTVTQFVISIILIISTLIIYQQMHYFQNKSLGFDKENVLIVSTESQVVRAQLSSFRNSLIQSSHITSVSATSNTLGNDVFWDTNFRREDTDEFYNLLLLFTDYDFLNTYDIKLLYGRNFSREYVTDKENAFIINEQAAKTLGYKPEEALGKKLIMTLGSDQVRESTIIGVVKNFHFQSLHRRIEPLVMYISDPEYIAAIALRCPPGSTRDMIAHLENTWKKIYPTEQLEFSFLNSRLNLLYQSEERIQKLLTIFTALSVFIASLGLFGLAIYSSESRRKEVGIRKVVGATVGSITLLLSRDFTKWVILANIFAWPAAWYLMNLWLQNFTYKIEIGWIVFIISGLLSLIIALLTVIFQAVKSAIANPVEALRYE